MLFCPLKCFKRYRFSALPALLGLVLAACQPAPTPTLADIKARGELRVAVLTEHVVPSGSLEPSLELSFAQAFADSLGLRLRWLVAANTTEQLTAVTNNTADLALGVPVTMAEQAQLTPSASYRQERYVLVSKFVDEPVSDLNKLMRELRVIAGSGAAARLIHLQASNKNLRWTQSQVNSADLLADIDEGALAFALLSAGDFYRQRPLFAQLDVRMRLPQPEPLAWAARPDSELNVLATKFLSAPIRAQEIQTWSERWQQPLQRLSSAEHQALTLASQQALPKLQPALMAAADTQLPWRLLAALAWQESHWRSEATSATGVAGVMMLTEATAERMQVKDRRDAEQSIRGGADYLRELLAKIPERVDSENRLWLALAAYNIGFMHLEDARILTQKTGGDPDRWQDVKQRLPMLREPASYENTQYGFARGDESVNFVSNIQRYYVALHWLPQTLDQRTLARLNISSQSLTPESSESAPVAGAY